MLTERPGIVVNKRHHGKPLLCMLTCYFDVLCLWHQSTTARADPTFKHRSRTYVYQVQAQKGVLWSPNVMSHGRDIILITHAYMRAIVKLPAILATMMHAQKHEASGVRLTAKHAFASTTLLGPRTPRQRSICCRWKLEEAAAQVQVPAGTDPADALKLQRSEAAAR